MVGKTVDKVNCYKQVNVLPLIEICLPTHLSIKQLFSQRVVNLKLKVLFLVTREYIIFPSYQIVAVAAVVVIHIIFLPKCSGQRKWSYLITTKL